MRYLLDTNILSEIVRNPTGNAATRARTLQGDIATSIIVAAELRFGAVKKGSPQLHHRIEEILSELPILPFDIPADATYARLRTELERAGRPIGANDMLIAAQALTLDLTLVTANLAEFQQVPGLVLENWLV